MRPKAKALGYLIIAWCEDSLPGVKRRPFTKKRTEYPGQRDSACVLELAAVSVLR
jgi:hypothetical protein